MTQVLAQDADLPPTSAQTWTCSRSRIPSASAPPQPPANTPTFTLLVDSDGSLVFAFENGAGGTGQQTYRAKTKLAAGVFYRLAVTRKKQAAVDGGVAISFKVNADYAEAGVYKGAKPVGNDANCELGRHRQGAVAMGLHGTLSQVRIWNT
ncbi:LamG-like jellyroll fold domain-containing protein [Streptomyces sp. NBC_00342]|uniref:LamG-like jellyroll fold domain-containing protein n=1 Tax=Streptomyces sp. NBC_00342 TaxID=2975718 RepID=UPI002E285EE9|nr:LamG-like jellyroll fold domain-containing protein [Streptomyces sp. NBC_00342]